MNITRLLMVSLLTWGLSACGNDAKTPTESASKASAPVASTSKTWRVAIEPIYPPYILPNETQSNFTGYDIDILTEIAKRENMTITFTPYPWDGLFNHLNTDEADIAAGGLSPNDERQLEMDFSIPYDETMIVLAVPKDSPIKNFTDAKNKNIAYQKNSSDQQLWEKSQNMQLNPRHATDSAWLSLRAVINATETQTDAALGHAAVFGYYLKQYKDTGIQLIENANTSREPIAFAIKKGNQELLNKLNKQLEAMKADGTLAKLHDKWIKRE